MFHSLSCFYDLSTIIVSYHYFCIFEMSFLVVRWAQLFPRTCIIFITKNLLYQHFFNKWCLIAELHDSVSSYSASCTIATWLPAIYQYQFLDHESDGQNQTHLQIIFHIFCQHQSWAGILLSFEAQFITKMVLSVRICFHFISSGLSALL